MPNWVTCEVDISVPASQKERLKTFLKDKEDEFSFGKIIPLPPRLNMESGSATGAAIAAYITLGGSLEITPRFLETIKSSNMFSLHYGVFRYNDTNKIREYANSS